MGGVVRFSGRVVQVLGLTVLAAACSKGPDTQGGGRDIPPAPKTFQVRANVLKPPAVGVLHGAFPDMLNTNARSASDVQAMERLAGKSLAWVQFENDWAESTDFPWNTVQSVLSLKKVPYIRIMPRSQSQQNQGADPVYSMENFLAGYFDEAISRWARMAKATNANLLVEFGPEVNGEWYSWNGKWNGGAETTGFGDPAKADGPERFQAVYRRVIDLFRKAGADNVTWVFHVDSQPQPKDAWNSMAAYYPGDDYIDWIGVSVFGAQAPGDYWSSFVETLDASYNELIAISPLKPVAVVEFGVIENPRSPLAKAQWIQGALDSLRNGWYPHVKAVSYWHERSWLGDPAYSFRIDSSAAALQAYQRGVADPFFVGTAEFTTASDGGATR